MNQFIKGAVVGQVGQPFTRDKIKKLFQQMRQELSNKGHPKIIQIKRSREYEINYDKFYLRIMVYHA